MWLGKEKKHGKARLQLYGLDIWCVFVMRIAGFVLTSTGYVNLVISFFVKIMW